jgi:hypothetical protein
VCLRTLGANIPYQGIKLNWMPVFAISFKSFGKEGTDERLLKVVAKVQMKEKKDGILRYPTDPVPLASLQPAKGAISSVVGTISVVVGTILGVVGTILVVVGTISGIVGTILVVVGVISATIGTIHGQRKNAW